MITLPTGWNIVKIKYYHITYLMSYFCEPGSIAGDGDFGISLAKGVIFSGIIEKF